MPFQKFRKYGLHLYISGMNFTYRQLETFVYSVKLRSFNAAAVQLHTTQSAVSKRVAEIEAQLGGPLLLRLPQGLQLTPMGRRLLAHADEAVALWGRIAQEFAPGQTLRGHFRVGVTELTALTWLAPLMQRMHHEHPEISLEPVVDAGVRLFERLQSQQLDLCIMPGTFWGPDYTTVRVGEVEEIWVVSPRIKVPRSLQPADFAAYPVIEESSGASKKKFYEEWRAQQGYRFGKVMYTNSTTLLRGLTLRGFGISQLSREYVFNDLKAGRLREVKTEKLPAMIYSAVYRSDTATAALVRVVELAQATCNFTQGDDLEPVRPTRPRKAVTPPSRGVRGA